jgi:hypothetical protein
MTREEFLLLIGFIFLIPFVVTMLATMHYTSIAVIADINKQQLSSGDESALIFWFGCLGYGLKSFIISCISGLASMFYPDVGVSP